ncbi:MAG: hypothetical protein NVSMB29_09510 [Candidatus Dormibacteria bacterium]
MIGLAVIIGLLILIEPVRARIAARLQAPDYATGIVTESGRTALYFVAGVVLLGAMSVAAFTSRQPGFGTVAGGLALLCAALAVWTGTQTWLDIASTPASIRGTVTYHFIDHRKGTVYRYVKLNGTDYPATPSVYAQTVDGRCAVLTYGPRTKVVTATAPCGP